MKTQQKTNVAIILRAQWANNTIAEPRWNNFLQSSPLQTFALNSFHGCALFSQKMVSTLSLKYLAKKRKKQFPNAQNIRF